MDANCIVLCAVGDTHCNEVKGLTPPKTRLETGSYRRNSWQIWLYSAFLEFVALFTDLAGLYPHAQKVLLCGGDMVDVDAKKRTNNLITKNRAIARSNALRALAPLTDQADHILWLRGTPAHVGINAEEEESMAEDVEAIQDLNGNYTWGELNIEMGGVRWACAHHYTMGTLPHTRGNAANKLAHNAEFYFLKQGLPVPDIVLRFHRHFHAESDPSMAVRVIQMPSFQGKPAYMSGKGYETADIGGLIAVIENGKIYDGYNIVHKFVPPKSRMENRWHALTKLIPA